METALFFTYGIMYLCLFLTIALTLSLVGGFLKMICNAIGEYYVQKYKEEQANKESKESKIELRKC